MQKQGIELGGPGWPCPVYKGTQEWLAVKKFFDISIETAVTLFHAASYNGGVTPKDVAKRIDQTIEDLKLVS